MLDILLNLIFIRCFVSMFKFKFEDEVHEGNVEDGNENLLQWKEATEEFPVKMKLPTTTNTFKCGDITLLHVMVEDIIKELPTEDSIIQAELIHSDLVPGQYEGGFKIWECTRDLAHFLIDHPQASFSNSQVLDLGCGAGLLGIMALKLGAIVHFQDYNSSVLHSVTIPNVLLNTPDKVTSCRFFAGDWGSFVKLTTPEDLKYDYILTSETIYNSTNYEKLCMVFKKMLKKTGIVLLAAKTYYFGVGGGLRQFEEILQSQGFLNQVCWKCSEGVQREILMIRLNDE